MDKAKALSLLLATLGEHQLLHSSFPCETQFHNQNPLVSSAINVEREMIFSNPAGI